ncbi:MAG: SIMPL domain-containing protein [Paludibacteraceae bacterium]|nr:SIMPL domain-containing protein [Paludibacteraceae bacterium]
MEAEKIITVTGRGNIHIIPDVTRVQVTIESKFKNYEVAYQMAEANLKDIGEVMERCQLSKTLPKTVRFSIDKSYHNVYDKGHYTGKQAFDGYKLIQEIQINLGMDNALLTKVVRGLGENLTDIEINIGYTVKDPRPHQLKMLERAVKDASEKAKIMAEAAGCSLGLVKKIDYSEHEIHIYSQARNITECAEAANCSESSLDITPEDLVGGEDVTVTWYLSNNISKQ